MAALPPPPRKGGGAAIWGRDGVGDLDTLLLHSNLSPFLHLV